MSRGDGQVREAEPAPDPPLIFLVDRAHRALQDDMVEAGRVVFPEARSAHNAVFSTLSVEGARTVDLAERAGLTRQSMGEVVRELVDLGIVEMRPDPSDGRAKIVRYTRRGRRITDAGYRHILDLEKRFAEEFGEKEFAIARDVLSRLADALDRIRAEGGQP
jgi:DNA-binding MarR family transcriptional regulator